MNNTAGIINFYPEDKNSTPFRDMIKFTADYVESYLRRCYSSLLFTDISAYITCSVAWQKNYSVLYVGQSSCMEFSMKKRGPGHSEKVGPDTIFTDSLSGIRFNLKI